MTERYVVWALAGIAAVLAVVFALAGIRRRIQRGRAAEFHIGFGMSAIDVVEGLSGRELTPKVQAIVYFTGLGLALLAVVVGLMVFLLSQEV
jgi:uncharacterized membrane protein